MLKKHSHIRNHAWSAAVALGLMTGLAGAQGVGSSLDPAIQMELRYIEALNNAQMPDYAEEVLKAVEVKYPAIRPLLKVKKLEQILQLGKFEEAEKIIKAEPDQDSPETWSMRTTMADYLFARNRYDEALDIYKKLFAKYKENPPESIRDFFLNSAYKYTQLLSFLKDDKGAIEAYRRLLKLPGLSSEMKRQSQYELAQLLVKYGETLTDKAAREKTFAEAQKEVEALLWTQDIWFGHGVALLAHIQVAKGDIDRAQKMIEDYREQLLNIDQQLQEQGEQDGADYSHLSPMAEARYQTGCLLMDEGTKVLDGAAAIAIESKRIEEEDRGADLYMKALNELVNVYVQYPSFAWAPEAMAKCEQMTSRLSEMGFEVESNITPAQRAEVAKKQFQTANMLYHQNQFENAIKTFERVLAAFPEQLPEAVQALNTVARACIEYSEGLPDGEEKDFYRLYSETATGYLAERFCNRGRETMEMVGNFLQGLSQFYAERNLTVVADKTKELFYSLYPEHSTAASSLMADAQKLFSEQKYEEAAKLYEILATRYTKSFNSITAQRMLCICYERLGKRELELEARENYVKRLQEGIKKERQPDLMVQLPSALIGRARLHRNIAIEALRDARNAMNEARRLAVAAPAAPAEGADAVPAAEAAPAENAEGAQEEEVKEEPLTVESATKMLVKANQKIAEVIKQYNSLVKLIAQPDKRALFQRNSEDKKTNESVLSSALYDMAYCYNALSLPEVKVPDYKKNAVTLYEQILNDCPWAEGMYPAVLLQLGTLYSTIPTEDEAVRAENAKKASEYFDRLSKDFADSDQARNALYLQGSALMELGYRTEAIAKFREMVNNAGSGKYNAYQLKSAAESLKEAKDYTTSRQAYKAALGLCKPEATQLINEIALGVAQIDFEEKNFIAVADAMEKFIADNPTSSRLVEANNMLSKACVEATMTEPDEKKRIALFQRAIRSLRTVQRYREKDGAAAVLDLRIQNGDIIETQGLVESKFGDKEGEMKYLRQACSHYFGILATADFANSELRTGYENVLGRYIDVLSRVKTYEDGTPVWEDLKSNCELYLQNYPNGKQTLKVRNALNEANVGLATSTK